MRKLLKTIKIKYCQQKINIFSALFSNILRKKKIFNFWQKAFRIFSSFDLRRFVCLVLGKIKTKIKRFNFQRKNLIFFVISLLLTIIICLSILIYFPRLSSLRSFSQTRLKKEFLSEKKDFLKAKKDLLLDPLILIRWMEEKNNDFLLIDVRDRDSYQKEHLRSAFWLGERQSLKDIPRDKTLVLYGHSANDPEVSEIALDLLEKGYNLKILAVGFNEFRHLKILWLPPSQWDKLMIEDYTEEGKK